MYYALDDLIMISDAINRYQHEQYVTNFPVYLKNSVFVICQPSCPMPQFYCVHSAKSEHSTKSEPSSCTHTWYKVSIMMLHIYLRLLLVQCDVKNGPLCGTHEYNRESDSSGGSEFQAQHKQLEISYRWNAIELFLGGALFCWLLCSCVTRTTVTAEISSKYAASVLYASSTRVEFWQVQALTEGERMLSVMIIQHAAHVAITASYLAVSYEKCRPILETRSSASMLVWLFWWQILLCHWALLLILSIWCHVCIGSKEKNIASLYLCTLAPC